MFRPRYIFGFAPYLHTSRHPYLSYRRYSRRLATYRRISNPVLRRRLINNCSRAFARQQLNLRRRFRPRYWHRR